MWTSWKSPHSNNHTRIESTSCEWPSYGPTHIAQKKKSGTEKHRWLRQNTAPREDPRSARLASSPKCISKSPEGGGADAIPFSAAVWLSACRVSNETLYGVLSSSPLWGDSGCATCKCNESPRAAATMSVLAPLPVLPAHTVDELLADAATCCWVLSP